MSETFAARATAVFGALGEPTKPAGWHLDTAQGFKPSADDALEQDSSEDGEEVPEPESLPGADDSEEERSYKQTASKCYRRAFEREEEEDEFDRVAAGASSQEQRPASSMEVLEDNIFDRMHSQSYRAAPAGPSTVPANTAAALEQQQPMDWDEGPPPLEPADAQHVLKQQQRQQVYEQLQENVQDQMPRSQGPSGQAWMPAQRRSGNRPREIATKGDQQQHSQHQHQQRQQHQQQRRVRFVDANSHAEAGRRQHQIQQQQQEGQSRGSRVAGRGRGGRRGRSFVPDHVRSPQKYTLYTLDEPIYVGQGDNDTQEMHALDHMHRADHRGGRSSRTGREAAGRGATAADDIGVDRGRWQGGDDGAPMLLDASAAASEADVDLDGIPAVAEPVRQLPPVGSIKFQPSSKRAKIQKAAGTASESQVVHQGNGSSVQANRAPESAPAPSGSTVLGAFIYEQTQDDELADGASIAPTSAAAAHGNSSKQRHYRRKDATDEG